MTGIELAALVAAIAWATICLQFVVIPFSRKAEKLHHDYLAGGVLDAALSFIETQRLIPALASLFERALAAQGDKRRKIRMAELLGEVDFLPDLEIAQQAMAQKALLEELLVVLQQKARRLWKWGLCHVLLAPLFAWAWSLPARFMWPSVAASSILVALSLWAAVRGIVSYEKTEGQFLEKLRENRPSA